MIQAIRFHRESERQMEFYHRPDDVELRIRERPLEDIDADHTVSANAPVDGPPALTPIDKCSPNDKHAKNTGKTNRPVKCRIRVWMLGIPVGFQSFLQPATTFC